MKSHKKMFSEMKSSPQTNNVNYNFLCEMIPHHMGAVRMGENAMKYSICQELRPIISAIIRSQKEGIAKNAGISTTLSINII